MGERVVTAKHKLVVTAVALFASLAGASSADAEPTVRGEVHTRVGRAVAPFYLDSIPQVESEFTQAVSFILAVQVAVRRRTAVGLRLPAAPSLVAQPAGSYLDDKAFGNPELFAEHRLDVLVRDRWSLQPTVRGAIGIPVAGSGPSETLTKNRVIAISAAMEGWREQELYVPGVLPLTASAALVAKRDHFRGTVAVEIPLLLRVRDAGIDSRVDTRAVSLAPNASVAGGATVAGIVHASVAVHLAALLPTPVAQPGGNVQLSVEPRINVAVSRHLTLTVDGLFAVRGPLANTLGIGLGMAVSL